MSPRELLEEGRLTEAVEGLTSEVRLRPGDATLRTFLFEMISFQGDLDRVAKQLDVLAMQGVDEDLAVAQYRNILVAETWRREVYLGSTQPRLGDPSPAYTSRYLDGIRSLAEGNVSDAAAAFQSGDAERRILPGRLNDTPFEDFRDADDRIGPFLELFLADEYHWIPWEMVRAVSINAPKHLRSLIWVPLSLQLHSGPRLAGFMPALYPSSHLHSSELVKLGRRTEWDECHGFATGLGQRVFFAGDKQPAILEIRELEFADADESEDP